LLFIFGALSSAFAQSLPEFAVTKYEMKVHPGLAWSVPAPSPLPTSEAEAAWYFLSTPLKIDKDATLKKVVELGSSKVSNVFEVDPSIQVDFKTLFPNYELATNGSEKGFVVWGPARRDRYFFAWKTYGVNLSEYAFPHSSSFNDEELETVLLALSDLPKTWNFFNNQQLTHFTRGEDLGAIGKAYIYLYDAWSLWPVELQRYAVFHELSHVADQALKITGNLLWESTRCYVSN
jgi:hypothetical protein